MQARSLLDPLASDIPRPLADRLRPQSLDEVVGQPKLIGPEGTLSRFIKQDFLPSIILWGPPGCGKTSIAKLLAKALGYEFMLVSAVSSGVGELKQLFEKAKATQLAGKKTLLMVDEIHRFNRAQQDVLLPFVEEGVVVLVGATTENPSFELNAALLSRAEVLVLERLSQEALSQLLSRAEKITEKTLPLTEEARQHLCALADGDGRYVLNLCEMLLSLESDPLTPEALGEVIHKRFPVYDKHQDSHYNLISALHKSLRGSDVDAALYWCARMLDGGEDPLYIARRLVRFAVEDIGLADPQAVVQANAAKEAYQFLGTPEGELAINQAVVYLATAPKSNANYTAFKAAKKAAKNQGSLMPPKHILNAPTALMKKLGYHEGYAYDHDSQDGFSGQNYFPDEMPRESYYQPVERGFEREIGKRMEYWNKLRNNKQGK